MELAFQTTGSWRGLRRALRWADDRGAAAFALPDHYFTRSGVPMRDGLTQLAALAAISDRMELVSLVSPVTFRHPAVLAKIAATINDIAPGRFALGIGTGWLKEEHEAFGLPFDTLGTRFRQLEEQLAYVASALAETAEGFEGAHYSLASVDVQPTAPEVRLVVGGVGAKRTPDLAGRYAGEYNVYPGPDIRARIERMQEAAIGAGRDPSDVLLSSAGAVIVAPDRASYERLFASVAEESGMTAEELEAHCTLRNTPRGDAEAVRSQLADLAEVGVERFYVQSFRSFDVERETEVWDLLRG